MMALAGDGRGDRCGYIELQSRQKLALELFDPSCDCCACSIVTVISLLLRSLCPVILVADDFKVILVADSKVIIVAMSGKMMTVILVSAFVLLLAKGALSGGHCNGMGRRFCADNPTRAQHYAGTCPEPCRERVSLIAPHDTRSIEYTLSESRVEERIVASQTLFDICSPEAELSCDLCSSQNCKNRKSSELLRAGADRRGPDPKWEEIVFDGTPCVMLTLINCSNTGRDDPRIN